MDKKPEKTYNTFRNNSPIFAKIQTNKLPEFAEIQTNKLPEFAKIQTNKLQGYDWGGLFQTQVL